MMNCQYAGLISAETFTHGHLGPGALDEVWRVTIPRAPCMVDINSNHYESMTFGEKLSADVVDGTITILKLVEADIYSAQAGNLEHASDKALIVVCHIV